MSEDGEVEAGESRWIIELFARDKGREVFINPDVGCGHEVNVIAYGSSGEGVHLRNNFSSSFLISLATVILSITGSCVSMQSPV